VVSRAALAALDAADELAPLYVRDAMAALDDVMRGSW
jgi:hypothetical protein